MDQDDRRWPNKTVRGAPPVVKHQPVIPVKRREGPTDWGYVDERVLHQQPPLPPQWENWLGRR